jgi:hypothetical protein
VALSVIGAGFGRTGTLSLKLALEQLGFGPCYHMMEVLQNPQAPALWVAAADGRPDWERIFEGYRATVDWPSATFYRELAEAYTDAKVILSLRDPVAWFDSTQATIFADRVLANMQSPMASMVNRTVYDLFDRRIHDKDHVIGIYQAHNARVREVIPPERLLVYQVTDGWGPLCEFLGAPVPDTPLPKVNTREEMAERWAARDAAAGEQVQASNGPHSSVRS